MPIHVPENNRNDNQTDPWVSAGAKRFVALARVSSREQEREEFSLEVQEQSLHHYTDRHGGSIVQLFHIAETRRQIERT